MEPSPLTSSRLLIDGAVTAAQIRPVDVWPQVFAAHRAMRRLLDCRAAPDRYAPRAGTPLADRDHRRANRARQINGRNACFEIRVEVHAAYY